MHLGELLYNRNSFAFLLLLRHLGLPILQGALSTMCGMAVLLAIRAYMVRAFVKTLFLVVSFGLYHGLLLLPIVLSMFLNDNVKPSSECLTFWLRTSLCVGSQQPPPQPSVKELRPAKKRFPSGRGEGDATESTQVDSGSTDSSAQHVPHPKPKYKPPRRRQQPSKNDAPPWRRNWDLKGTPPPVPPKLPPRNTTSSLAQPRVHGDKVSNWLERQSQSDNAV